jgi:chitinase
VTCFIFTDFSFRHAAFAVPDANQKIAFADANDPQLLQSVVSLAHAANKKVILSVGGWTGSKYFSGAVASDSTRQTFAQNMAAMIQQYNLDGM